MVAVQKLRWICSCALSDGVPRRSFYIAVVVGTILNIINQGDALLANASVNGFNLFGTVRRVHLWRRISGIKESYNR